MAVEPKRETRRRQKLLHAYVVAEQIIASEKTYSQAVHKRLARKLKKYGYEDWKFNNFAEWLDQLRREALAIK